MVLLCRTPNEKLANMGKIFVRKKEADRDRKEIKGEGEYLNCVTYIYAIVQEQNVLKYTSVQKPGCIESLVRNRLHTEKSEVRLF